MNRINDKTYLTLRKNFELAKKKILKEKISKNRLKLEEYLNEIIDTHNALVIYAGKFFSTLSIDDRAIYRSNLILVRDITIQCLTKLNKNVIISNDLCATIDKKDLSDFVSENTDSENEESSVASTQTDTDSHTSTLETNLTTASTSQQVSNTHSAIEQNSFEIENEINTDIAMPPPNESNSDEMSKSQAIQFLSRTIHSTFNGNPKSRDAFVNAIELAKEVLSATHLPLLKKFVLTKLEDKALDAIDKEKDIDGIIRDLKTNIQHDNSKVIEGRLMSLNVNKLTSQEFSTRAEELADELQKALIIEGISREKAKQMAIDRTTQMCRQSARSELVKSVIAASTFSTPKDVIAKLITEQNNHEVERQILTFRSNNSNYNRNGKNNFRGRNGNFRNNRNFNGNNGNNRSNNWNNSRGRGNRNNRRGGYRNGNNNYHVRVSENLNSPPEQDGQATFSIQKSE